MRKRALVLLAMLALGPAVAGADGDCPPLERVGEPFRGERPAALVQALKPGLLRQRLAACLDEPAQEGARTIGHRGAPLRYPEHSRASYLAAARLGAATVECDVTFTGDGALVCRHSQCDLHRTTDILQTDLAAKCSEPFRPALLAPDGSLERPASARCCTSDIALEDFLTLEGRHDRVDPGALNVDDYLAPPADPERPVCQARGEVLTHRSSIDLFRDLGVAMAPELKTPEVPMPFQGLSRANLADRLVAAYRDAGVPPERVWLQTFEPEVARHWLATAGEYASRVVLLDGRYADAAFDHRNPAFLAPVFQDWKSAGLVTLAPPLWMLVEAGPDGIEPSAYARAARRTGLQLITWTAERSGPLADGGGWYYQTLNGMNPGPDGTGDYRGLGEGDQLRLLATLYDEVGVRGVFSDWPATTAWVDSCLADPDRRSLTDPEP